MVELDRAAAIAELVDRYAMADRAGAVRRTRELVEAGVDPDLLTDIVGDAQRHVGALWQADQWTVAQEHTATAIAEAVLAALDERWVAPEPPRGTVAMVAADGEWHVLPARLATRTMERAGLRVHFLGGSVPPTDLVRALPDAGVEALAISVTLSRHLPGAARTVAAAHAAGLPALVGGQAVTEARARQLGADGYAASPELATELLISWHEQGPPSLLSRPSLQTRAAAELHAARRPLVDAIAQALGFDPAPPDPAPSVAPPDGGAIGSVVEELEIHLAHLEAAVLLDDASLYHDGVRWLADVLAARGRAAELGRQLAVLSDMLAEHPEAQAMVASAQAP